LFGRQAFALPSLVVSRQSSERQSRRRLAAGAFAGTHDLRPTTNGCRFRIDIPRAEDPARPAANIIGMIPGADPAVADEAVILSAHLDHLGASPGSKPTLFPGAEDDA